MNRKVLLAGVVIVAPILFILVANLGRDPKRVRTPMIGRAAPDFALRGLNGEAISLQSLRGKPLVLNFWATWCVPCLAEHAVLQNAARSMGKDVQFVGIVFNDQPDKVLKFLTENGSQYPSLLDAKGETAIAYGVTGVPETFFISRDGVIADKYDEGPLDADVLNSRLRELLR